TATPVAGSVEYWNGDRNPHMDTGNWIDGDLYTLRFDKKAESMEVFTYESGSEQVSGLQWTITSPTGWAHTVLAGTIDDTSLPGKTRFVINLGSNGLPEYRPFPGAFNVNPQEQFSQASTEVKAYVFDDSLDQLAAGVSALVPELLTSSITTIVDGQEKEITIGSKAKVIRSKPAGTKGSQMILADVAPSSKPELRALVGGAQPPVNFMVDLKVYDTSYNLKSGAITTQQAPTLSLSQVADFLSTSNATSFANTLWTIHSKTHTVPITIGILYNNSLYELYSNTKLNGTGIDPNNYIQVSNDGQKLTFTHLSSVSECDNSPPTVSISPIELINMEHGYWKGIGKKVTLNDVDENANNVVMRLEDGFFRMDPASFPNMIITGNNTKLLTITDVSNTGFNYNELLSAVDSIYYGGNYNGPINDTLYVTIYDTYGESATDSEGIWRFQSGSTGGDPYIEPYIGDTIKLPNIETNYCLFHTDNMEITASVRTMSSIHGKQIEASDVLDMEGMLPITNGVLYDKFYIKTSASAVLIDVGEYHRNEQVKIFCKDPS
ncbi:MAG: hypothetical protein QF535_11625, partial [Anaerolineales bacterium]|nr:hypothetical protein [Anaerolineales bacterium]